MQLLLIVVIYWWYNIKPQTKQNEQQPSRMQQVVVVEVERGVVQPYGRTENERKRLRPHTEDAKKRRSNTIGRGMCRPLTWHHQCPTSLLCITYISLKSFSFLRHATPCLLKKVSTPVCFSQHPASTLSKRSPAVFSAAEMQLNEQEKGNLH